MSETAVAGVRSAWRSRLGSEVRPARRARDARRALQLVLAATWLLDAALQYQPFRYSKAFTRVIRGTAASNWPVKTMPSALPSAGGSPSMSSIGPLGGPGA